MYKILMTGMSPNLAGLETFALNVFRNIDKNKFQIDFIKRTKDKIIFEDELIEAGVNIIYIPRKYSNLKNYEEAMKRLFEDNPYDAIWDNSMRIPNIDFLSYAKKYGIKERVIHSHTSRWEGWSLKKIFHYINKYRLNTIATKFIACSNLAADFMFTGKGRKNAILLNNAIDFEKYVYSADNRKRLRQEYNLDKTVVIGHVGRINPIKNQKFLLDILLKLQMYNDQYKLVLVGDVAEGSEEYYDELKKFISTFNLQDKVVFAGRQEDISSWLSVMDVFVMPSLYEGLPFAAVEAQANGLPLIVGTGISREVDLTGNVQFLSLDKDVSLWIEQIISSVENGRTSSESLYTNFSEKGYILKENIRLIEDVLLPSQRSDMKCCRK